MFMRNFIGLCGLLGLGAACTADSEEVRPRERELTFPTGIAVDPNDRVAFIASANSELRFDSGTITVLELETVQTTINQWIMGGAVPSDVCGEDGEPCCEKDPDRRETLTCDESLFIRLGASVRIGNFATDISIQKLDEPNLRVFVPTRGDPSVAWADWDDTRLSCGPGTEFPLCDDEHRLSFAQNDAGLQGLGEEPFGVFADSAGEFAMVTHMTNVANSPQVTLIDSPKNGPAVITDMLSGVFAADPTTGIRGATGIAGRAPNQPNDIVYVGSRSEDRIQTFSVGRPINGAPPFLLPSGWFFLDAVGGNTGGSSDTRGMQFSADGSRLYLVNRRPPSLQILDTSIGPTGLPLNRAIGATDICRQASTVSISGTGDAERAYVTCFQDGQIYVVDPRQGVVVEDIVLVGRGPYGVATAPSRNLLFVTNFLEDTVAVVDIAPDSATRNRVVLRIGKPRPL
jgi:DNA-binding beta-propeller fold protein YncE